MSTTRDGDSYGSTESGAFGYGGGETNSVSEREADGSVMPGKTRTASDPLALPPVMGPLMRGTSWLALQIPLQILFSFWSLRLIIETLGPERAGAYRFGWGFAFLQLLFDCGVGAALQRQLASAWARGDRAAVDRTIAAGMLFYIAAAIVQATTLLGVAYLAVPHARFAVAPRQLVVKLLWLQAVMAPCFGVTAIVAGVLQAARRYELMPRCEVAITISRFAVLVLGVRAGVDFLWVAVAQTIVMAALRIGPALWVMVRKLGYVPCPGGAGWADYRELGKFSLYTTLIQLAAVLADQVDTAILGFMLPDPGPSIAAYDIMSKPVLLLCQAGGMLSSLILPAVASLAAVRDRPGLERIQYDGTRLSVAALMPMGLMAWIYAGPFLSLWFGRRLGYDAAELAPLMRLHLVATIPLVLAVPIQMVLGLGRIRVIALAALAGSLANLLLSCYLAARLGVAGVILGTVLTTLVANLLVPGLYVVRVLEVEPYVFLWRSLAAPMAGAVVLIGATWTLRLSVPVPSVDLAPWTQVVPLLLLHIVVGTLGFVVGYSSIVAGRRDLTELVARLRRRDFVGLAKTTNRLVRENCRGR